MFRAGKSVFSIIIRVKGFSVFTSFDGWSASGTTGGSPSVWAASVVGRRCYGRRFFKKRRMAAHTPVLRNTTVRSIPSAMPVKSVRNRLPEDFFRVVEACVSRRRVVSRAKEERFRRPVWLARLSDCRCRRKVWFVSSHVRRSARSLIPVTMSESSCFSARIAARPLRAV